jgi:hypothetical protein
VDTSATGGFSALPCGQKSFSKGMGSVHSDFKVQRHTRTGAASGKTILVVTKYFQCQSNLVMDAAANRVAVQQSDGRLVVVGSSSALARGGKK